MRFAKPLPVVWPGKLLGTIAFEPLAERLGYKKTIYFTCFAQIVGVLSNSSLTVLLKY